MKTIDSQGFFILDAIDGYDWIAKTAYGTRGNRRSQAKHANVMHQVGPPSNAKPLKHGLSSLKKAVNTLGNRALDKRTFGENVPTTHPPHQHHQSSYQLRESVGGSRLG